ncbi:MAG: phage/plasmid primase, P4 family [Turicibacter sp.]|nr:phage/plasmid primase, P4 family [Turicibacter sp.]
MKTIKQLSLENTLQIITKDTFNIHECIDKEPLVQFVKCYGADHSILQKAIASNFSQFGQQAFEYLAYHFSDIQAYSELIEQTKICLEYNASPMTYDQLEQNGYKFSFEGHPYQFILDDIKKSKVGKIGYDSKQHYLDITKCSSYILTRIKLLNIKNQFWAYDQKGYYVSIEETFLKKQIKDITNTINPKIWRLIRVKELIDELRIDALQLNTLEVDHRYINVKNGLIDVNAMKLLPHDPDILTTVQLPINYTSKSECPRFIQFLNEIFEGDQERIQVIQEIFGYTLTTDVKLQKFFVFLGLGKNGKSLLISILEALCGKQNCSNASLNQLESKFGLQAIEGKLLNVSAENENDGFINSEHIKLLTGDDCVQIEKKYKDSYSIKPFVKLFVVTNNMFKCKDTSYGFLRRLYIVPFNVQFADPNQTSKTGQLVQDPNLKEKLLAELDGILRWSLEGYHRLKKNSYHLTSSQVCQRAIDDYEVNQNPFKAFIKDHIVIDSEKNAYKQDVIWCFNDWVRKKKLSQYYQLTDEFFWAQFKKAIAAFTSEEITYNRRKNDLRIVTGITLRDWGRDVK